MWSYAIFSLLVIAFCYAVGDIVAKKTNGMIISLLFVSVLYIIGYITGIIPQTSPADTGMLTIMSQFGTLLVVTNIGTMIDLKQFIAEWKTVVMCLVAMLFMSLVFWTLGAMVYGREMALCAIPPVSGGLVAALLVSDAATAAGYPDMASLSILLVTLQTFVGIPVSSLCLKKYCRYYLNNASQQTVSVQKESKFNIRFLPPIPEQYNGPHMILSKLLLVCLLGYLTSVVTDGALPAAVVVLVYSILFQEIGFLDKNALQKSGMYNFIMFGMLMVLPASFSSMTMDALLSLIGPIIFFLLLGVVSLLIGSGIMGFVFKVDFRLAAALGPTAMFGFPSTLMITTEVVNSFELPDDERQKLMDIILPKMIIAGFTTVTVASVFLGGFIAPIIFA